MGKNKNFYDKYYKKYTKKQLYNAFLLLLDEKLKNINCVKVQQEGNWSCWRCDLCMIDQYVKKFMNGEVPRIIKDGVEYAKSI